LKSILLFRERSYHIDGIFSICRVFWKFRELSFCDLSYRVECSLSCFSLPLRAIPGFSLFFNDPTVAVLCATELV
jgi:hypothetical protein